MVNMKYIILAKNAPNRAKYTLQDMGFEIIESAYLKGVQPPLAYHPDMQIVRCGDAFVCAPECYEYYCGVLKMADVKILCGSTDPVYHYPGDIAYNVAVTGRYALHYFRYTDPVFVHNSPYRHIDVKQGYTKCSVCVVSEDALITSDTGIAMSVCGHGPDVLHVSSGGICLPGYDYGFIGGASGLVHSGLLCFCGDIKTHPDYQSINNFCKKHLVDIVSLCPGQLVDIGTIIALG